MTTCQHPNCSEPYTHTCDVCGTRFCRDHGSACKIVAQIETSCCWLHSGFNVDAE
jgi:hypothetical protein